MYSIEICIEEKIDKAWAGGLDIFTITYVADGETILTGMALD